MNEKYGENNVISHVIKDQFNLSGFKELSRKNPSPSSPHYLLKIQLSSFTFLKTQNTNLTLFLDILKPLMFLINTQTLRIFLRTDLGYLPFTFLNAFLFFLSFGLFWKVLVWPPLLYQFLFFFLLIYTMSKWQRMKVYWGCRPSRDI